MIKMCKILKMRWRRKQIKTLTKKLKDYEDTGKAQNKPMTTIKLNKDIQNFVSKQPRKIEEMDKR